MWRPPSRKADGVFDRDTARPTGTLDFSVLGKALDVREPAGVKPKVLCVAGPPLPVADRPLAPQERELI